MQIICEHGFYKFYPDAPNELVVFADKFGVELVKMDDFYTYPALADLPDYSIKGQPYGGIVSPVNYSGRPWSVFRENKLNYDVESGTIVMNNRHGIVGETPTNYVWVVIGIPSAFSALADKTIITGFEGWLNVVDGYTIITRWQNASI